MDASGDNGWLIEQLLQQPEFWHWFALAAVLVVIEVFAPGVMFLWLGIAAFLTGIVLMAFPDLAFTYQGLVFAFLAVISLGLGRMLVGRMRAFQPSDHPGLNRRTTRYKGRIVTLEEATRDGQGRIRLGDGSWTVQLEADAEGTPPADLPAGTRLHITGADGATLRARPVAGPGPMMERSDGDNRVDSGANSGGDV